MPIALFSQERSVVWPMAGMSTSTSRVNSSPSIGTGPAAAAVIKLAQALALQHDAGQASSSPSNSHRIGQEVELDAFVLGRLDLLGMGRHVLLLAAIDDVHLAGAQAPGSAGGVDGDVTAADHGHTLARPDGGTGRTRRLRIPAAGFAERHIAQEIGAVHDALLLLAGMPSRRLLWAPMARTTALKPS